MKKKKKWIEEDWVGRSAEPLPLPPAPVKKVSPNFIQLCVLRLNGRPVMVAVRDDQSVWFTELTGLEPGTHGTGNSVCMLDAKPGAGPVGKEVW